MIVVFNITDKKIKNIFSNLFLKLKLLNESNTD